MAKVYTRKHKHKTTYYAHFSLRGERHRIKLEAQNKEQAKKMATEIQFQMFEGKYKSLKQEKRISLKEVAAKYIVIAEKNKRSWKRDDYSLRNILPMLIDNKELGEYSIDEIKVLHIQKYQIRRKRELDEKFEKRGISERDRNYATVNRELACLRHIFYMAMEWELLIKNPVASKAIKFDKEKARNRALEDYEFRNLFESCNEKLYPVIVIALNTGMRKGEILNLRWEDVDLGKKIITVKQTKNDEDRQIPINDFLLQLLRNMSKRSEYVLFNSSGGKRKSVKTAWHNTLVRANITDFRFHDLRHTVATRLSRAKVTESVIALILGHTRSNITGRYINPLWDEIVEAVSVLGDLCHEFVTHSELSQNELEVKGINNKKIDGAV